jgi:eukaryotic-like serine/threonine-protein kinase
MTYNKNELRQIVDSTQLRDLLAMGKWKDADNETIKVMCLVAGREKEGWLTLEDIYNFPAADLRTIDRLWVKYSQGHFGFSVQKRIYQSLDPTQQFDELIWVTFCDRVGWRVNNQWAWLDDLTFDLTAPVGHLPARGIGFVRGKGVFCLLSRQDL